MLHSINKDGLLISVSDAWLLKLGYTREEVIGRRSSDFLTPESRAYAIRDVLPAFFQSGRTDAAEYQMVCKDGRVIDVLLSAVLDDSSKELGGISLAVITDVTALKMAERQLALSEARYRGLVEDQSELVSLASPDGQLRFVNHAYARHYERQPDEMIGKNLFDFIPQDARPAVAAHLRRVCSVDVSVEDENQVVLANGQTRWMAWTNRALTDAEGRVTAIHSVGRDIEDRVTAERHLQESEARYRLLADNSTDMILLVEPEGQRTYSSPACRKLLGFEPEEMLQIRSRDAVHPDDIALLDDRLARSDAEAATISYRMRRKDGRYIWVEAVSRVITADKGQPPQWLVVVRDIERRVLAEQLLRESEARYRLLADNSTDMVFQLDLDLVRRYVSPACREILGYAPEELIDIKPVGMVHPEDADRVTRVFRSLVDGSTERSSILNRFRHRDGHWIWVEAQLKTLKDKKTGVPLGIIGTLRDVSARKVIEDQLQEANRRLQVLAEQDGLTGLANRRFFDDALSREFEHAHRHKRSLGLLMIDVDWFKSFNDFYGHPAGDECLKRIGAEIKKAVGRPGDVAARYGGEEFALLLPDTDQTGATAIAERIRQAVGDLAIEHSGSPNRIATISVGAVSLAAEALGGPETLLRNADRALYRAKDSGRNSVAGAPGPSIAGD
jgi:diguanylate cyclase (GGDEF)-like protein/PAS domain S-box-containing protein